MLSWFLLKTIFVFYISAVTLSHLGGAAAAETFPSLSRICNPTTLSIGVCNAEKALLRIENPSIHSGWIANPTERVEFVEFVKSVIQNPSLFLCDYEEYLYRVSFETPLFICSNSHSNHHLGMERRAMNQIWFGVRTKSASSPYRFEVCGEPEWDMAGAHSFHIHELVQTC